MKLSIEHINEADHLFIKTRNCKIHPNVSHHICLASTSYFKNPTVARDILSDWESEEIFVRPCIVNCGATDILF